ncbi:hypothetical protein ACU5EH_25765 [Aliivibrio salmonicida]|uniref:hypothetical protein n=1 Tax=Aliivibrio salmonicida TaxID=40269 RepID=UPI00406CA406
MTKYTLLSALLGCLLSGTVLAEKVTYDKAVADSKAYQDSLPNHDNATSGLSAAESASTGTPNQMGKWIRLSLIPFDNAGSYSKVLTSRSIGAPCIKGSKGIIPTTKNSSSDCDGNSCSYWKDVTQTTYNYSHGYTAECR